MNRKDLMLRLIRGAASIVVSCTALAAAAQTPPRPRVEMWFSPNLAADNNQASILDPAQLGSWRESYAGVEVFSTYFVDLVNRYNTTAVRNTLSALKADGKKISVEVGGMDMGLCNPRHANGRTAANWNSTTLSPLSPGTQAAISEGNTIEAVLGQRADYLIIDGPFERAFDRVHYGETLAGCSNGFTYEFIAQELVFYMQQMKVRFPSIKFLLGTNFPHWHFSTPNGTFIPSTTSAGDQIRLMMTGPILNYKDVLNGIIPLAAAGGVPLSGVVIDTPYNYIVNNIVNDTPTGTPADPLVVEGRWSRIAGLVDQAHANGLKAYVFVNSEQSPSSPEAPASEISSKSRAFHEGSVAYSLALNSRNIPTDGHIIASWNTNPTAWFLRPNDPKATVPGALLPESTDYTFSNVFKSILSNVNAHNEPVYGVIGQIDGLAGPGNGYLVGWACGKHVGSSIQVQLYTGGAGSQGQFQGAYTANVTSEPAIASACKTSGANYRFAIPVANRFPVGTTLYVYGIAPAGGQNKLLTNSGSFASP